MFIFNSSSITYTIINDVSLQIKKNILKKTFEYLLQCPLLKDTYMSFTQDSKDTPNPTHKGWVYLYKYNSILDSPINSNISFKYLKSVSMCMINDRFKTHIITHWEDTKSLIKICKCKEHFYSSLSFRFIAQILQNICYSMPARNKHFKAPTA